MARSILALCLFAAALPASAEEPVLRWGGDEEGGGPYLYSLPENPDARVGFEWELMQLVGEVLGRKPVFYQCQWDNLPDLLRKGDIDVIVNGYELTHNHRRTKISTVPYYVYELRLIARKADSANKSWDDFKVDGKKIGVLQGTAAERYCQEYYRGKAEIIGYPGTTQAFEDVVNGKIDATVTDNPPATFYAPRYPALTTIGEPAGRGYYVMYLLPGREELRDRLDAALMALMRDGRLKAIYQKYGIWNPAQDDYFFQIGAGETADIGQTQGGTRSGGWAVVWDNLGVILLAAGMTVILSVTSMPIAVLVGLIVAVGRVYGPWPVRFLFTVYVEILRGTPLLLQLFLIFYILPAWGIVIDAFPAAVLGLAINYSAYEAEIYRAGLQAIPTGQMEAALALGLSRAQAIWHVIIPQAVRLVVPPVTNDFINLFKDTSVCSVITVVELTKRYSILSNSTGAYVELAVVTSILYLAMSYPLALFSRRLEKETKVI